MSQHLQATGAEQKLMELEGKGWQEQLIAPWSQVRTLAITS
jgi:hypothetical protein